LSTEFEIQDTLERMSCAACGIIFAAPKEYLNSRRQDSAKNFHCPNGHSLVWPKAKNYEQLTKEVETLTAKNKELQQINVGLRSQVDQLEAKLAETGAKPPS
jgi:predicted RNase H-like nuclease (RuvC/YqgF family)